MALFPLNRNVQWVIELGIHHLKWRDFTHQIPHTDAS
jgi:hypothetical protein